MGRFLQIDAGVATAELYADQAPTVLPSGRSFVDVSIRPEAQLGGRYNVNSDTFRPPPPSPPTDPDDLPVSPRELRGFLRRIP